MNYNGLITLIDEVIKANGRHEITGNIMNVVLHRFVEELGKGYQFVGRAMPTTDPGTPDARVCYLATTKGNYEHFGNVSINEPSVLYFDTQWHVASLVADWMSQQVTWSELVEMRDNGMLTAGAIYRITDYVCTTTQENTVSANHAFDIIIRADDESHLNENAYAAHHDGDTYFADCKLEAWELKYSLDNDTDMFAWADDENGKGVIYRMKDEWGNEAPFDFKNMLFTRDIAWFGDHETWAEDVLGEVPETDLNFYFLSWVTEDGEVQDASIVGQTLENDEGTYSGVYNNEIKETTAYSMGITEDATSTAFALPCTIIVSSYAYEGGIFYGCYNNAFGNNCYSNTFGNNCYSNTFRNNCYSNAFRNNCYSNAFGNDCSGNTFGNDCYSNTFGNNCYSNTFGNDCYSNTFGNNCYSNAFGNNCYSNTFGNGCYNNAFRNNIRYLTIFDGVRYCSVTGGSGSGYIQNAQILNGVQGASVQNKLTVMFETNKTYTQIAGLRTDGTLRIYNPMDE